MSKYLLLHPDDFTRYAAADYPVNDIQADLLELPLIVKDAYGACKPGHAYEVERPDVNFRPSAFRIKHPDLSDRVLAFRYAMEMAMPTPPKFIGIDLASDETDRRRPRRKLVSLKRRAREQRRLDWASNVRRRKRRKELAIRTQAKSS